MKRFEKLAIVLILLWLIKGIVAVGMPIYIFRVIDDGATSHFASNYNLILASVSIAITFLESIACGTWLCFEAKLEKRSTWLWCLAGVAFQVLAVIAFIAYIILKETRNKHSEPIK